MRKKQNRFLYSSHQPVHITAYNTTSTAAVAGFPAIGFIIITLHNNQEYNKSISLPAAINDNTG